MARKNISTYLPELLGPHALLDGAGDAVPARSKWKINGASIVDVPPDPDVPGDLGSTEITFTPGGGGGGSGPTLTDNRSGTLNNVDTTYSGTNADTIVFTSTPTITGFTAGTDGRRLVIVAQGSGPVTLKNENTGSTAANRVVTALGADLVIPAGGQFVLVWDSPSSRWRANTASSTAGIHGKPIEGTGGAPSEIGAAPTWSPTADRYNMQRPSPWLSVRHFGADPTGVSDSSAAFKAAHDAVGGSNAKGATIFIPEGVYRLDSDWVIAKNVTIRGAGMTSGNGGTELQFAAGKKIIVCGYAGGQAYADPSTAQGSRIKDLGIVKDEDARIASTLWTSGTAVVVGTKRIVDAGSEAFDGNRFAYLECLKAGTTGGSRPSVPAHPDEFSADFVPGGTYYVGMLVRGSNNNAAIDATGSNLITTHLFRCTTAGVAGGAYPTWNTGGTTTSGAATFTAVSSSDSWVNDNGVIWASRSDAAILAFCKVTLSDLHLEGAGGPGVHLRGNAGGIVVTNCNGWSATNLRIVHCGVGFMTHGGDAQAGVGTMIDVEGAGYKMPAGGGIGIYDASGVGNTWVGCQVANVPSDPLYDPNGGGSHSYAVEASGLSAAVFVNCYTEGYGHLGSLVSNHFPSGNVLVIGGAHSAGFTDLQYPAQDGSTTQAQIISDAGQGGNRAGVWTTRIGPTQMQYRSGTDARITEVDVGFNNARNPISESARITGISAVSDLDVGRYLILSGCATGGYNGTWAITSVVTKTTVATCTFAEVGATGDTITRSSGSWITDGFVVGDYITVTSTTSNNITDAKVVGVTATVLTLDTVDLTPEGPVGATVTAKDVYAIIVGTSSTGQDANNGSISWAIGGGLVYSYLGTRDDNGSVFQFAGPGVPTVDRSQLMHTGAMSDGGGFAGRGWWAITSKGLKSNVCMAFPGVGATYGADQASVDDVGIHIPSRLWFGDPADYLRSIEFGSAAPTTKRHAQGSFAFNKSWDGSLGTPIGWQASVTGTPGTWHAIYAGRGGRLVKAMADANQSISAAEIRGSIKTTGALGATRTLTLPHPASEAETIGFDFYNACTGAAVTVQTGTGTTVSVSPGNRARLEISPDGVTSIASYTTP